ncbi:Gfo/Idh/MocA family oxidoreductase [Arthrobacter sp. MSA 4-2]|uniref:Gfo/Idh/MocA family protein n=1 Tax=Arthrobacter sp. MSA 4-2 TaxID=2794349 RepID=UPI0027DE81FD|nr:Gfo/Idh/MocA family oxidoreductase [Arthrobacter sp. MSA 4-2]
MTQLGIGIVGTGMMGRIHADAARRVGARVVAVAGSSRTSAERAVREWAGGSAALEVEALITHPDVDVVHLCVPNHLHEPLAARALEAGKHVVCEKPLALDVAGARALAGSARMSGLTAAVPFIYRYHPLVAEARARIQAGSAGNIHLIHGSYLQDWLSNPEDTNWRVDAGKGGASRAFADIGSHWCDLIEWVSGHRIQEVSALTKTAYADRPGAAGAVPGAVATEDIASVAFRTDRGAVGSVVISQVSPGRKNRLWFEISTVNVSVGFDQEQPETLWVGGREGNQVLTRDPNILSPEAAELSTLPAGHPQGYHDAFRAFVADVYASVSGGAAVDRMPTFEDGLRTAAITEAVLASAEHGTWVQVGDFSPALLTVSTAGASLPES